MHLGKTESVIFGSKRKLKDVKSFEVRCKNIRINNVKEVMYLGLQIDSNLSGENAVMNILKKANARLKFLYRYKDMLNFSARKTLRDDSCNNFWGGASTILTNFIDLVNE